MKPMEPESSKKGITFVCEHCEKPVYYEFLTPIAVRCNHCDSIFDARLQIVKGRRKKDKSTSD